MRMRRRAAALLPLLGLAGPAAAQQVLYEPLPPRGSAYVRFVNALPEAAALRPDFTPPQTLGTAPAERVGAYAVVENVAGRTVSVPFTAGARRGAVPLRLEPGGFTTVLLLPEGAGARAVPLADQTEFNQARAKLAFYNAAGDCPAAGLTLQPDGPAVFAGVAPGAAAMRAVNPVTARVQAACGGDAAAPFALEGLEAGGRYSVFLMAPAGPPIAFLNRDRTLPWRR